MQNHTIKALLFDLGGVVFDVDFQKVFKSWASLSSLDEVQIKSRFKMDEPYQQHERGTIDACTYFDHLRSTLQLTGSDSQILEGWNSIFGAEITESLDAIDQVQDKIPSYGFTNTNRVHQIYWEHHFPRIQDTFDKIFISSEIGLRKPDAAAFEYILDEISIKPEEMLFFDDTVENTEGAKKLGIQTVLVTGFESVVAAVADF
jgi:epoxide hydrolase-like predicted phosphatase